MKRCIHCGEERRLDEMARDRSKPSGVKGICKACDAARCRRYYEANREKKAAYYRANRERILRRLAEARHRESGS